jgi:hypothetical protein
MDQVNLKIIIKNASLFIQILNKQVKNYLSLWKIDSQVFQKIALSQSSKTVIYAYTGGNDLLSFSFLDVQG